jgi:hypothetical protein
LPDETKLPSEDELWEMVKAFSQQADDLQKQIEIERGKNADLNTENSGWLKIYQQHLSVISELKARITQLESLLRGPQGGS